MTKQISITNVETGETIVRDMTPEEIDEYELGAISKLERIAKEQEAKNTKLALFEKLGITEEEAKLLLS